MTAGRPDAKVTTMKHALSSPPNREDRPARSYTVAGHAVEVPGLAAGLHIVATPIGNLGDITLRGLAALAGADLIACEDTRVTRRLLDRYAISVPLTSYHDHNAESARPKLLRRLAEGAGIALVSDAGTPLVSDPGYKLVRAAQDADCRVVPVPGASALLAALVAAGLPTDRFLFAGFPPAKTNARRAMFEELAATPATLIFYETGARLAESLADMLAVFGDRPAALARELTKLYEAVRRSPLAELAEAVAISGAPKGELVVLVGAADARPAPSEAAIDAALREALAQMSVSAAADEVSEQLGVARRAVYARALALKDAR